MNILFTICARAGSKGVKNKNTRLFCGKPLIYYTAAAFEEYRLKCGTADRISLSVNTDSDLLLRQLDNTGIDYLYVKRKDSLAGDVVSKKDVIKDTLVNSEKLGHMRYDIVADLDLTSPLRTVQDIDGTIKVLAEDDGADIAYSVVQARRSPYFNMVSENEDGYYNTVIKSGFVARQQAPGCYDMNASIYAYRRDYLLSERLYERKALIWTMKDTGILDIDSEDDFKLMEIIAEYLFKNEAGYSSVQTRTECYAMA